MKISARNQLKGTVRQISLGPINAEVSIELTGGTQIVAVVTRSAAENLQLSEGKEVYAIVKATNVMVAVE